MSEFESFTDSLWLEKPKNLEPLKVPDRIVCFSAVHGTSHHSDLSSAVQYCREFPLNELLVYGFSDLTPEGWLIPYPVIVAFVTGKQSE